MFKKGTRVVVVDEMKARDVGALVRNGEKGTIGEPHGKGSEHVRVHMDSDSNPAAWSMAASCLKRIRKQKKE